MRHYLNATLQCCNGNCSRSGNDHDKEEKIKKLEDESNQHNQANEEEINKQKELDETKKANMELSFDELDEILESLRAELEEIKNKTKEDKDRESKSASKLEHIGYDNYESKNTRYHVLKYEPHHDSFAGDKLFISLGSSN